MANRKLKIMKTGHKFRLYRQAKNLQLKVVIHQMRNNLLKKIFQYSNLCKIFH